MQFIVADSYSYSTHSKNLTIVVHFYFMHTCSALGVKKPAGVYLRQTCFFLAANLGESTMMISQRGISKTKDNRK